MAKKDSDVKQQASQRTPKNKAKPIKRQRKILPEKIKKQQALVKEYNKQRRRLKAAVKRAEKRGYVFTDFIPEPKSVVNKPEVERLKRIKGQEFYKYGKYYDLKGQQYISGIERKKQEQKAVAQKAAKTRFKKRIVSTRTEAGQPPNDVDDVLQYLFELVANWQPDMRWSTRFAEIKEHDKNVLANALRGAINDIGERQVARNCQAHAAEIKDIAWYICYGYSGSNKDRNTNADIVKLVAIIRGRALTPTESKELQDIADSLAYETTEE